MDEFLLDRVKELKEIEERIDRLHRMIKNGMGVAAEREVESIRYELADRIRKSEEAYAAF